MDRGCENKLISTPTHEQDEPVENLRETPARFEDDFLDNLSDMSDDFFDHEEANVVQRRDLEELSVNLSDLQSQVSSGSDSVMSLALSLPSDQYENPDDNEQPPARRANVDIDLMRRYLRDATGENVYGFMLGEDEGGEEILPEDRRSLPASWYDDVKEARRRLLDFSDMDTDSCVE